MSNPTIPVVKNVAGHRVLYVMATLAEYQTCLSKRFTPLICAVGPVEAAINVSRYLASNPDIDLVISLGSAGSACLEQAKIYQVSSVSYRDMDASAFGFEKGITPFLDEPATIELPLSLPNVASASLSTGANVVSGEAYREIDADMVDMETWSIVRACRSVDIPFIGFRGISDGVEPVSQYSDWTRYLEVIDERLALAVDQLEDALESGVLKLS